jgi:hypothetical protein
LGEAFGRVIEVIRNSGDDLEVRVPFEGLYALTHTIQRHDAYWGAGIKQVSDHVGAERTNAYCRTPRNMTGGQGQRWTIMDSLDVIMRRFSES